MSARDAYIEKMKLQLDESDLVLTKLDEIRAAGECTWEATVAEMEKVRDIFLHSCNYFKSQI